MGWRVAKSLLVLRDQINQKFPDRSKDSDGTIGDSAHASRKSEHNPDPNGVVRAMDITHDPAHGLDSEKVADALRLGGDPRILYIISNKKIANPGKAWRPYDGANPHSKHFHISAVPDPGLYDSTTPWNLDGVKIASISGSAAPNLPLLRFGMQGDSVRVLQRLLGMTENGLFNFAVETSVKQFQTRHALVSDGVVGSYTWEQLVKPELKG